MTFINNTNNTDNTVNNILTPPANPSTSAGSSASAGVYNYIMTDVMAYVIAAMDAAQKSSNKSIAVQAGNLQQTIYTEQNQAQLLSLINYANLSAAQKKKLDDAAKQSENNGKKKMSTGEWIKDWFSETFGGTSGKAKDGDTVSLFGGNLWNSIKSNVVEDIGLALIVISVVCPVVAPLTLLAGIGMFVGEGTANESKTGTWFNGDKTMNVDAGTQTATDTSNITTELTTENQDVQKQRDTYSNTLTVLGQQQSIQSTDVSTATQAASQTLQQIGSILQALLQIASSITAR